MYRILIVDDELIEREGIKYLIKKYQYEMEIFEAEDGENALEYIKNNPVDILFTDIRMPFMSGLELIEKARELSKNLKVIIFSAYEEFEYAKKAIDLNVIHYILKPIDINEFLKVFSNIIKVCDEEKAELINTQKILEGYNKGIKYEKQKILFDLLQSTNIDKALFKRMATVGLDFKGSYMQLVMIDSKTRLFDLNIFDFEAQLESIIEYEYEYLNLNEYQSVIILKSDTAILKDKLSELGKALIGWVKLKYNSEISIAFSRAFKEIEVAAQEFYSLEKVMEYRFFFEDDDILFSGEYADNICESSISVEKLISNINQLIDNKEYCNLYEMFQILLGNFKLRGSEEFSLTYVKYICSEIAKRMYEKSGSDIQESFKEDIERIYKVENLNQLMKTLRDILRNVNIRDVDTDETNRKVIQNVVNIIKDSYMYDISLQSVAEKVFLTPSYLSYLFKKETGQSFMKYITACRLQKAKDLLINTNMRIVDIGENVGYPNLSYFCMIFRSHYGMSPAKYREKGD